jgi:hypothetical protein
MRFFAHGWDSTPVRSPTNDRHPDHSRFSGGGKDPLLLFLSTLTCKLIFPHTPHTVSLMLGRRGFLIAMLAAAFLSAQQPLPSTLVITGHHAFNGVELPFTIHHLPITSFPDLPRAAADTLTRRGCLIPQSAEAHHPENVIHGSFEHPGSSDWALLCKERESVSLLVFFASNPGTPVLVTGAPERDLLRPLPNQKELGFALAIDPASPERVHEAQLSLTPRPPGLDHDAIAESRLDGPTVYRYFSNGAWTQLPLP